MDYAELGRRLSRAREESGSVEANNLDEDDLGQKLATLMAKIDCSAPRFEQLKKFPDEYVEIAFSAYCLSYISLSKLAELLEMPLEEAKTQLAARNLPINLGVSSELELLSDIQNA